MKARRQVFCSFVICIGIVSLEGLAVSQQKRKRPQRSKPVATSTTAPVATATKNLSRGRAADLIQTHPSFKTSTDSDIPVGTFWYDYRSMRQSFGVPGLLEDAIQPLVDNGIVTFKETGGKYSVWYHEYVVEITQEGEAEAKGWVRGTEREWVLTYQGPVGISSPNVTLFHIPVAERKLIQVTGIAFDPSGMRAQVEFTWKWLPTAQGKFLPNKVPAEAAHGGVVQVQLYDDGWRMGQMLLGLPFVGDPQPEFVGPSQSDPTETRKTTTGRKWERAEVGLPAPKLLSPANGTVFHHYPRDTKLKWKPVPRALSYSVEIQFFSGEGDDGKWLDSFEGIDPQYFSLHYPPTSGIKTTLFDYQHVGVQKGRWRVWAVNSNGKAGHASEWWEFTYTQ